MVTNLFAYGTLMFPEIVEALLSRCPVMERAVLKGYARFLIEEEIYAAVIPKRGAKVEGLLLRDLTPEDLEKLDLFEGSFYSRSTVSVTLANGKTEKALVYRAAPGQEGRVSNRPWSPERFIDSHLAEHVSVVQPTS